eukprot:scaffold368_cov258-Pinguiococcus_pyrenoidosus.AAC.4
MAVALGHRSPRSRHPTAAKKWMRVRANLTKSGEVAARTFSSGSTLAAFPLPFRVARTSWFLTVTRNARKPPGLRNQSMAWMRIPRMEFMSPMTRGSVPLILIDEVLRSFHAHRYARVRAIRDSCH